MHHKDKFLIALMDQRLQTVAASPSSPPLTTTITTSGHRDFVAALAPRQGPDNGVNRHSDKLSQYLMTQLLAPLLSTHTEQLWRTQYVCVMRVSVCVCDNPCCVSTQAKTARVFGKHVN